MVVIGQDRRITHALLCQLPDETAKGSSPSKDVQEKRQDKTWQDRAKQDKTPHNKRRKKQVRA